MGMLASNRVLRPVFTYSTLLHDNRAQRPFGRSRMFDEFVTNEKVATALQWRGNVTSQDTRPRTGASSSQRLSLLLRTSIIL